MKSIAVFIPQNAKGIELFEKYILPICEREGINCVHFNEDKLTTRKDLAVARFRHDFILLDCSVESAHIYNTLDEIVKRSKKTILVSRTNLPNNILGHHQFAPIHNSTFSNEEIGEWLYYNIPRICKNRDITPRYTENLQSHYWINEQPATYFASHRGSQLDSVQSWKLKLESEQNDTVRIVPNGQYFYETECSTPQQMWECVARLFYEMKATKKIVVFKSKDYFDSFWTCSELITLIKHWTAKDNRINWTYFLETTEEPHQVKPLYIESHDFPIPKLTPSESSKLFKILNNSDPLTSAPETQIAPTGWGRINAFLLKKTMGYYLPEFTNDFWWHIVKVPCLYCRTSDRKTSNIHWSAHLDIHTSKMEDIDYFGYFWATKQQLASGIVSCPRCKNNIKIVNNKPPRTRWKPILRSEKEKGRPIIEEIPVWEVEI